MTTAANPYAGGMLPVVWDYTHPGTGQVVHNVEALCRRALNRIAAGASPPLADADYDEGLAWMLGAVDVLARTKWRPERYPSLGDYLAIALPTDLIDHWRQYRGRFGEKCVLPAHRDDTEQEYEPPDTTGDDRELAGLEAALPSRSRRTLRKLGEMLVDGRSYEEIGAHFGRSREWVAAEVQLLKADISLFWLGPGLELERVVTLADVMDDYYEEAAA